MKPSKFNTQKLKHKFPISIIIRSKLMLFITVFMCGCEDFIDLQAPPTSVNKDNVYIDKSTASAVLTGMYAKISNSFNSFGLTSLSYRGDLSADNIILYDLNNFQHSRYYTNSLQAFNSGDTGYWVNIFPMIYTCNSVLEGLSIPNKINQTINDQLVGEAKFMRAFFLFYAVNLYGDIPLPLSTDYKRNSTLGRTEKSKVYEQIVRDLTDAVKLLHSDYLDGTLENPTTERVRPNKSVATALLSRVYLFTQNYEMAEQEASRVISESEYYEILPANDVFLKNSRETIWSLQPVGSGKNTDDANLFLLPTGGPNLANPFYLSAELIHRFDANDSRFLNWINELNVEETSYYYPAKYKVGFNQPVNEYTVVMRLAEQYLNRAEARVYLNNIDGAIDDLDVIRQRAGIPLLKDIDADITKDEILGVLLLERRKELFAEWGHRWFDLQRTGTADNIMSTIKGDYWQSTDILYPIPLAELLLNNNLSQNPGYTQ